MNPLRMLRNVAPPVALLLAITVTPVTAQEDVWALTNVRVVTTTGRTIERGIVVIRDGLVAAVGADVVVPPDARVLDLTGKTDVRTTVEQVFIRGRPVDVESRPARLYERFRARPMR